ncbi:MAG: type II secretion system GspH family protein [Oscillospiraceae bacterium]|nr:type II secretion system GspH family protein [Oscillospiraceae bacterium]
MIKSGNIRNLKNRHGFTMVELLVVVGIIAVLTSITVPFVFMSRGSTRAVNEKARDFFFTAQGIMTDARLSPENSDIKLTSRIIVEVDKAANSATVLGGTVEAGFENYFIGRLRTFLLQDDNNNEFYYLVVDGNYRVERVYMSRTRIIPSPPTPLPVPTLTFSRENTLADGTMVGVFPIDLSGTNFTF